MIRKQREKGEKRLLYVREKYASLVGASAETLVFSSKIDALLSAIFSADLDQNAEQVYDSEDRPLKFAQRACEITKDLPFVF